LLDWSVALRIAAVAGYAIAFVGYAARLAMKKLKIDRVATVLAVFAVASHTAYLVTRWIAAGQMEILAREATGDVLSGTERFWYLVSHPPYTNLFDALNFVAWAMMVCYLIIERKWGLRVIGVLAVALALVAMGEASLVSGQNMELIDPLVPALQSYWILIHVGMLFVSYSLFTLGAVCALLYLVRTGTATAWLGGAQALLGALLLFAVGRSSLLLGIYQMAPGWVHQMPSRLHKGRLLDVTSSVQYFPPGSERSDKLLLPVAGVGPFLLAALVVLLAGAIIYFVALYRKRPEQGVSALGYKVVSAGFAVLTIGLALLAFRILKSPDVVLPDGIRLAPGQHGPFRFGLASNYAFGVLALVWGTTLGFLVMTPLRDRISAGLPDPRKLEDITYKVVIAGWPLLTIGIVMGGMWANEAWGRFWGWDPKETWALITWVVYAGYLHTRITLGWAGKRPAVIAVFAFAVVVFTFMGVNLGLTGEGLHVYGSG
jgi:ABC-type transport system involved in cytochrome c biogenesis permease subunit